MDDFCIKPGYKARPFSEVAPWTGHHDPRVLYQHAVYERARDLCDEFEVSCVLDLGCGDADKAWVLVAAGIDVVGVAEDVAHVPEKHARMLVALKQNDLSCATAAALASGTPNEPMLIVCADVVEHMEDPRVLLCTIAELLSMPQFPVAILSTPDRDIVRRTGDMGPPGNTAHVREWNHEEFIALLNQCGLRVGEHGHLPEASAVKRTVVDGCEFVEYTPSISRGTQYAVVTSAR